jgi:predicted transcriptional regulator
MSVSFLMIEKIVRAFLLIFILVALVIIVATILGFSAQVEELLENVVPTRYQIMANSDAYIRKLSMGLLILAVPVGFYVVIRLLDMRESRREKFEREKRAAENLNRYQQAFIERMKKY